MSIVFWTDTWRPESFFDKVKKNRLNGMHTLCLLGKGLWRFLGVTMWGCHIVLFLILCEGELLLWAAS